MEPVKKHTGDLLFLRVSTSLITLKSNKCIHHNELWTSSMSSELSITVNCSEVNGHDENTMVAASEFIAAFGAGLFYILIFFLSILSVCLGPCVRLSSSQGTFFVFLIGALLAFINVFTNADNLAVKLYFRISITVLMGVAFTLFGAALFFSQPRQQRNEPTLGRKQPSMGLVVGSITFPLTIIEIVLIISTQACKNLSQPSSDLHQLWTYVLIDKSLFLSQKVVQAAIYLYLRNKVTCVEYRRDAQFYFRIMSFYNLMEWVDSQVNVDSDVKLTGVKQKLDSWFDVFTDLYKALIIDYRLLCCLLFLEHSLEIQTDEGGDGNDAGPQADDAVDELEGPVISYMAPAARQQSCIGYMAGCLFLIVAVVSGLYYVQSLNLHPWVKGLPIIVNLVMVSCGICLLCINNLEEGENRESPGVKIMVSQ